MPFIFYFEYTHALLYCAGVWDCFARDSACTSYIP